MNDKKKSETAKPASGEKKPGASTKKKLKELSVKVGEAEFTGLCTAKRKLPGGGSQVFLRIKGEVGRWFNSEDVVK